MNTPKKRRRSGPSGPTVPHAERTHQRVEVTLPPPVRERLDAMQAADGVTRSAMVAGLIEDEWERRAEAWILARQKKAAATPK